MPVCNICGGEQFMPGPKARMARSGVPPRCVSCYSLERHRSLRECLDRVPREMFSWRRAIQFAPDPSLDPTWFRSYEGSVYEGENSLDLQDIDRPGGTYDFISLSGVLELVPDDQRAFGELMRIASSTCLIHCTFVPLADATKHYNKLHGAFGRYHLYGLDLTEWFNTASHNLTTIVTTAIDPVTEVDEPLHFFCRQHHDAEVLTSSFATGRPPFEVSVNPHPARRAS